MDNTLCTEDDFKQEAKLRKAYEQATATREAAQTELDILQSQYEDAAARLYAAETLCAKTPDTRLKYLRAERDRLQAERDQETARVEGALQQARDALVAYLTRFVSAATGWLSTFERNYPFDQALVQLARETRQRLTKMVTQRESLSAIFEVFDPVRRQIETWTLAPCPAPTLGGVHYRVFLEIPRLQDLIKR